MTKPTSVTMSEIARSLRAVADAGLSVREVVLEEKRVRIVTVPVADSDEKEQGPKPKQW